LDILQATIARLAANSFSLRGWSVTLVAGLFALAAKDTNPRLAVIAFLPVLAFWLLDAYYLTLERWYRRLFDRVAARDGIPLFSLDLAAVSPSWREGFRTCFSGPLLVFHGALFLTVSIVAAVFRT
jgi:hypothetical protein